MTFRSELDATRERAEAAEQEAARLRRELDAQPARIADADELEVQLLDTRHRLRALEASQRTQSRVRRVVAVIASVVLGAGGAGVGALAVRATERDRGDVETPAPVRIADPSEIDYAFTRAHSDLGLVVSLAHAGLLEGDLTLGWVAQVVGDAPASVGDSCRIVLPSAEGPCGAEIRCGERVVHALACRDAEPVDVFRSGDGVDVWHRSTGWVVRIRRRAAPASPAGGSLAPASL